MGAGTLSCGEWLRLRAFVGQEGHPAELATAYQLHAWVDGFISGANIGQPDLLASRPSSVAVYAWIDNYCRSNPLDNVAAAATILA